MYNGLDIFATLRRIVQQAMAVVPFSPRGSLLVREGERLVYRALIGFDASVSGGPRVPSDGGKVSASPPFGPEAAPEAAHAMCAVPAAAWYRAHSPEATALHGAHAEGASVLIAPFQMHGEPAGYLALEQTTPALPEGDRRTALELLAASAGSALERRFLYREHARAAQETRLLESVLGAVAASIDLPGLIETIGDGIRNIQPGSEWTTVDLALADSEASRPEDATGAGVPIRRFRAPSQPIVAYWNNVREGVVNAGRELQISVEFVVGSADGPRSQQSLLDEGVRRGVHGVVIAPIDPVAVEPAIRRASEAGIPVLTIDSPAVEGSRSLLYIGTDNLAAGKLAGEMMARLLPDGGLVGTLLSSTLTRNREQRIDGFKAAVDGKGISVAPCDDSLFDPDLGMALAVATLERLPALRGALGVCGENGPSWGLASKALGRAGELKIVAFDLVTATRTMLAEGVIHAAVLQREYDMGYRAVEVLYDMLTRGVRETLAELPPSRFIDTGVDVVTLERTPWSTSLSDQLCAQEVRKLGFSRRRSGRRMARSLELLVIGMAGSRLRCSEERERCGADSLIGRVMEGSYPIVIDDTSAPDYDGWDDVVAARRDGLRTLVGVPLLARGSRLGVLVLGSGRARACSLEELALIERIGATAAVAIENAELVQHLTERSRDLERSNAEQESLLGTIAEMSSPVVPVARGVLVMPLVGTLNAQRASRFMEALLREITEQQARVVLIDVTGMAVVDADAVDHLVRAARAAGLLGAEVVLVGISPGAARLMVDQGFDLGGVVTRSTLELGFAYALAKAGGRVVYASPR